MLRPSRHDKILQLIQDGYWLHVNPKKYPSAQILRSVQRISNTQCDTTLPWLERVLCYNQDPHWHNADHEDAESMGYSLSDEINVIKEYQNDDRSFYLMNQDQLVVTDKESEFIDELNQDIASLFAPYLVQRFAFLQFQNQYSFLWILVLLIFTVPTYFLLEFFLSGLGKTLVPLAFGTIFEIQNIIKKYSAGYSLWQIKNILLRKSPLYLSVIISAAAVQPLYFLGHNHLSVLCLCLTLLVLPFYAKITELIQVKTSIKKLIALGKIDGTQKSNWYSAKYGDYWWLPFAAMAISIVLISVLAIAKPSVINSGLFIVVASSSPWFSFFGLVWLKKITNHASFNKNIKRIINQNIVSIES